MREKNARENLQTDDDEKQENSLFYLHEIKNNYQFVRLRSQIALSSTPRGHVLFFLTR